MFPLSWRKTQLQSSSLIAVSLFYGESFSFADIKWVKTLCLTLALCVCSTSAFGESTMVGSKQAKTYSFDIPILRADIALIEFAEQAGITLLFSFDETKLKTGNRLNGQYEIIEALDILLASTGLYISMGNAGQISIASKVELEKGKTVNISKRNSVWGVLVSLFVGSALEAQEIVADDHDGRIEEVVVISQKGAGSVSTQELPASVVTISESMMRTAFTMDLVDIGHMTPNAELGNVGTYTGYPNFNIRGMGINGSTRSLDPAVGVFVDGIYVGYTPGSLASTFDREAVEILRGPQGTLLGRNVTGGAVLTRSKRPTGEFGGNVDVGFGDYGATEFAFSVEGALSDTLAAKVAVIKSDRDGYYEDNNGGSVDTTIWAAGMPESDTGDKVGVDLTIIRPMLKWTPSDAFDATFIFEHLESDTGSANSQNIVHNCVPVAGVQSNSSMCGTGSRFMAQNTWGFTPPAGKYDINHDLIGYTRFEVDSLVVEANWNLDYGVVTALAGWRDMTYDTSTDFDGTPFTIFHFNDNKETAEQTSIEVRYASTFSDTFDFVAGVSLFDQEYMIGERRNFFLVLNSAGVATTEHKTSGIFGEGNYHVNDELTLTLGGRWTKEEKSMDIGILGSCELDFSSCSTVLKKQGEWSNFSPKVAATYNLSEDQMIYASYTKGFRSGSFNSRATVEGSIGPSDPETAESFELGYKSTFLDGRGVFNLTYFQADYEDLIFFVNMPCAQGACLVFENAGSAEISGWEAEFKLKTFGGLSIDASVGTNDPEYTEIKYFDADANGTINAADNAMATGWDFVKNPELTYSLGATYETAMSNGGAVITRVAYFWKDDYMTDVYNKPWLMQESFGLVDASIAYVNPAGNMRVSLYGKNLTDEEYFDYAADVGGLDSAQWGGTPATWGVRVTYEY
jgi:iron complex outermembrane receptor protein